MVVRFHASENKSEEPEDSRINLRKDTHLPIPDGKGHEFSRAVKRPYKKRL